MDFLGNFILGTIMGALLLIVLIILGTALYMITMVIAQAFGWWPVVIFFVLSACIGLLTASCPTLDPPDDDGWL